MPGSSALPADPRYYAVYTKPQKEGLVARLLEVRGFLTLYLHYSIVQRHARKTRQVERAYFARYVFAGVVNGGPTIHDVARLTGVASLVHLADRPLEIPLPVIDELRARGDKLGRVRHVPLEPRERRWRFKAGETVNIIQGPLIGLLAVVGVDRGAAVQVWLEGFGSAVEVILNPAGLKSASPAGGDLSKDPRR